jgi:membrane associated rhomboid family serine protease
MSGFLQRADETPLTYVIVLAYVTMAFLTDPMNPPVGDLIHYGAAVGFLIQDGEHWRLLTHAFLHGGIIHLAFNTFFLIQIGPMLERRLGSVKFGVLYLISAVSGGMAGSLWHHELVPLVGGSGALFGMLGAAVAVNMRSGRHLLDFLDYHGPRQLLGLIAINLILGLLIPFVSNAAHIGGLVSGFALAFCFLVRGRSPVDGPGRAVQTAWVAVFVSVLFYCAYPVVRWDYLMSRAARADDTDRAQAFALAFVAAEPKPFTSTFSVSQLSSAEQRDELLRQVREEYGKIRAQLKGG